MCEIIQKLVVTMMELVLLILIEVHANHLGFTSFHPFSFSSSFTHLSKLDEIQKIDHDCFKKNFELCELEFEVVELGNVLRVLT